MANNHPETFERPNLKFLKENIVPNCHVKVCHSDERFWVQVAEFNNDWVLGNVANDLLFAPFSLGEIVIFHIDCIFDFDNGELGAIDTEDGNIAGVHDVCNRNQTTEFTSS
jgi:hypothetical protein